MKTLSLKVLGCAAAMALLTNTRAQDDVQAVPPPDTNAQSDAAQQQQAQPPVIIMQVPAEGGNNGDANNETPPNNGPGMQPMQSQPMQNSQSNQQFRGGQGGQNRFGNGNNDNNDRGGRSRFGNRSDNGGQRGGINSVPVGDPNSFTPPATSGTNGTGGLILNFRDAQIDQVLNYLSDAAGFIIELDTRVSGTVSVWSSQPVSRNDAVTILNSALAKNGYSVIQAGRILRVMNRSDALQHVPIITGGDPSEIPQTGDTVTQIIPVHYVSARQLIVDLSSMTPSTANIIANDAGNSIIITDTQENIHHVAELVKAIDSSAEDVTEVKVFHLTYHDPVEVANLLTQIFTDQGQNGGQTAPIRFGGLGGLAAFGGGRGGFGGGFGGGRGGGGLAQFFGGGGRGGQGGQQGGNQGSIRPRAKVVAVPDQRMQSVLVTAPKDVMAQVGEVITEIDKESDKVSQVTVYHMENADVTVAQKALADFEANSGRSTTANQNSILTTRANQALSTSSGSGFGTGGSGFGGGGSGFGGGGGGFGGGGFGGGGGGRGGFGGQ